MATAAETRRLFNRPLATERLREARGGLTLAAEASVEERAAIAAAYDLAALEHLSYQARLEPYAEDGWRLVGALSARFTQRCVVTLAPLEARLEEPFERLWRPGEALAAGAPLSAEIAAGAVAEIERETGELAADAWRLGAERAAEVEVEPTPEPIDPAAAALESFTLALDPYPRAPGAVFDGAAFGPPGAAPLSDEEARPFSALKALRDRQAAPDAAKKETGGQDDEAE